MSRTMSYYDLRDALAEPGCAVCRLVARDTERYLDGLLWESVNDPGVREQLRRAQGFCHEHSWQLNRAGASLGVAIIARDVLGSVLKAMEGARFRSPPRSLRRAQEGLEPGRPAPTTNLAARLNPQAECPACVQAGQMEEIYLATLSEQLLGEEGLLGAYKASDGLCLPHFHKSLASLHNEASFRALLSAQRAIWGQLVEHLAEYIRKNDYRFRGEPWGDESDAWLRALAALAGEPREAARA